MPIETYRGMDGNLYTREVPHDWERVAEGDKRQRELEEKRRDDMEDTLVIKKPRNGQFENMRDLRQALDQHEKGIGEKLRRRLVREVPRAAKRAVLFGLGGLIFYAGLNASNCIGEEGLRNGKESHFRDDNPIGYNSMMRRDTSQFGIDDYPLTERKGVLTLLAPYMDDAEKRLPEIEQSEDWVSIDQTMIYAESVQELTRRFVSSWQRSCYLHSENGRAGYGQEKESRTPLAFAPRMFKEKWFEGTSNVFPREYLNHGTAYLRFCVANGRDLADTYASYFSTEEEIRNAMIETKSKRYFPSFGKKGEVLEPGYGSALKQHEQDLINSALAIHYLTDADGDTVHFERLPTIRRNAREGRR